MNEPSDMVEPIPFGSKRVINGVERVFYHGYWVKTYQAPADTLTAKKRLIEALTRRLFNHVEHGINIPGSRLEEARAAFKAEADPARRRVKGAMLAGALFNRGADIFTKLVELQACGVEIASDNPLLRECGHCLLEALELGKTVMHRSGEEGIDELWGEPFKAFSIPVEAFYESRYIKIAQTMRDIDQIADALCATFCARPQFPGIDRLIRDFADAAKIKTETLRTDPDIFEVWTSFAVAGEQLQDYQVIAPARATEQQLQQVEQGRQLLAQAHLLISDITRARVPMPKSTAEFVERCEAFRAACTHPASSRLAC